MTVDMDVVARVASILGTIAILTAMYDIYRSMK